MIYYTSIFIKINNDANNIKYQIFVNRIDQYIDVIIILKIYFFLT